MSTLPFRIAPKAYNTEETRHLAELASVAPGYWPSHNLSAYDMRAKLPAEAEITHLKKFAKRWLSHPDERFITDFLGSIRYNRPIPELYNAWLFENNYLQNSTLALGLNRNDAPLWEFSAKLWDELVTHTLAELTDTKLLLTPFFDALLTSAEQSWSRLQEYQEPEQGPINPAPPASFDPRFEPFLAKLADAIKNNLDLDASIALASARSSLVTTLLAKHSPHLSDPRLAVAMIQSLSPSLFQEIFKNPSLSKDSQEMFQEWVILQIARGLVTPRIRALTKAMDSVGLHLSPSQRLRLNILLHEPNVSKSTLDSLAQIPDLVRDKEARPLLMHRATADRRYLIMEHSKGPEWLSLALRGLKERADDPNTAQGILYREVLASTTAANLQGLSRQDLIPWISSADKDLRLLGLRLSAFVSAGPKTKPMKPPVARPRHR